MCWLHVVFPIIELLRCGRAASRLTEEVSSSPEPQGVPSSGFGAWGMSQGFMARVRSKRQLAFARLKHMHGVPAQKEWISVLGTPSMTARRQPQAHSVCPRGGERAGAASTLPWLRSLRRPSQCTCATDSFVGWREDGNYTSIGCWGWGSKGRIRVRAAVCVTIAATRGFARFLAQATRCLLLARDPRVLRGGGNTHLDR